MPKLTVSGPEYRFAIAFLSHLDALDNESVPPEYSYLALYRCLAS